MSKSENKFNKAIQTTNKFNKVIPIKKQVKCINQRNNDKFPNCEIDISPTAINYKFTLCGQYVCTSCYRNNYSREPEQDSYICHPCIWALTVYMEDCRIKMV